MQDRRRYQLQMYNIHPKGRNLRRSRKGITQELWVPRGGAEEC